MMNNFSEKNASHQLYLMGVMLLVPFVASAAVFTDFKSFVDFAIGIILTPLISLIVSLAVAYFVWGVSKYILHGGDPEKRKEGYRMMIYGVIAIFVMVSVWGFVNMLINTFGF